MAERVGFEPRPYSRFLTTGTRVHFSNIFIFLSVVYYVCPVSVVSPGLIRNRHQTDTKVAEGPKLARHVSVVGPVKENREAWPRRFPSAAILRKAAQRDPDIQVVDRLHGLH